MSEKEIVNTESVTSDPVVTSDSTEEKAPANTTTEVSAVRSSIFRPLNAPLPVTVFRFAIVLVVAVGIALFQRSAYSIGGAKEVQKGVDIRVSAAPEDEYSWGEDKDGLKKAWTHCLDTLVEEAVKAGRQESSEVHSIAFYAFTWYFRVNEIDAASGKEQLDSYKLPENALTLLEDEKRGWMKPQATCLFFSDDRFPSMSVAWGESKDLVSSLDCAKVSDDKKICRDYEGGKLCRIREKGDR